MNNCYCSICSQPMLKDKPIAGYNFCCSECKRLDGIHLENRMEHHDKYVRKSNAPVGVRMYRQPADIERKQSYHPSRQLRVRGITRKRLTTKKERIA